MKAFIACIQMSLLFCSPAIPQESQRFKELLEMGLGDMLKVQVATGTVKQLSEAPAVVSVITSEDIKVMGARILAEAVERVPGLHVIRASNRLGKRYAFRGIHTGSTPQVLVLVDGVNIAGISTFSTPNAFTYPTEFIDRIDVIRGPGSAVYGSLPRG